MTIHSSRAVAVQIPASIRYHQFDAANDTLADLNEWRLAVGYDVDYAAQYPSTDDASTDPFTQLEDGTVMSFVALNPRAPVPDTFYLVPGQGCDIQFLSPSDFALAWAPIP